MLFGFYNRFLQHNRPNQVAKGGTQERDAFTKRLMVYAHRYLEEGKDVMVYEGTLDTTGSSASAYSTDSTSSSDSSLLQPASKTTSGTNPIDLFGSMKNRVDTPVVQANRKGLEESILKEMSKLLKLPEKYTIGDAVDDGGCFFDALAQTLNVIQQTDVWNEKVLRMHCHDFYSKNKEEVDKWNNKDYGGIDKGDEYFKVQYTKEECDTFFHNQLPIWGRPHIEGRMLCRQLNLSSIYVIELIRNPENNSLISSYICVTPEACKTIENMTLSSPLLMVEQSSLHFVPVLLEQYEEQILSYPHETSQNQRNSSMKNRAGISIVQASRKGLAESNIKKLNKPLKLPAKYIIGEAVDDGGCFFDALAQSLNAIRKTDINSEKYLRMACHDFYLKNKDIVDKWNESEHAGIDQGDEYYKVQYTKQECDKHFRNQTPLWGRYYIEGRILCAQLELPRIFIIELIRNPEDGSTIANYGVVTKEGYRPLDEDKHENDLSSCSKDPILIVSQEELHFVPVLPEHYDKKIPHSPHKPSQNQNFNTKSPQDIDESMAQRLRSKTFQTMGDAELSFTGQGAGQNKLAEGYAKQEQEKIWKDKVCDIKALFVLYGSLHTFLIKNKDKSQPLETEIYELLTQIAKVFYHLKWDINNVTYIRNVYGKMNYKKTKKNDSYIDFERFGFLYKFQDETINKKISNSIAYNFKQFQNEFELLTDNVLFVLKKELSDKANNNKFVIADCTDIIKQLKEKDTKQSKLADLKSLLGLIDIYYDLVFTQKICQPDLIHVLKRIIDEKSIEWRYTLARVLSITGEACKNFSDTFKNKYQYLPLTSSAKIRDALGHAHDKYIIKASEEAKQLFSVIANYDLERLQTELQCIQKDILIFTQRLSNLESAMNVIEDYKKMTEVALEKEKELVNLAKEPSPLSLDESQFTNVQHFLFLKSLRINILQVRKLDLLKEMNKVKQVMNAHKSINIPLDGTEKKEKRIMLKIKELESKSELKAEETKVLESAKKELHKLAAKARQANMLAPKTAQKKSTKNIEEIQSDLKSVQSELLDLALAKNIEKLCLLLFSSTPKSKKREVTEDRVGNSTQGYIRHAVDPDGECGYTAFGITRKEALKQLTDNLVLIQGILQPAVKEALLTQAFYDYLLTNYAISTDVTYTQIIEALERYATDLTVLQGYLHYDVRDTHIDAGWAHPCVLQALAHIRNIELRIWHLGDRDILIPHCSDSFDYAVYTPPGADGRTDLLFIKGNHFERLEFVGYKDELPTEAVYPFDPMQNQKRGSDDKLVHIIKKIEKEMGVLDCLHRNSVNGQRNYASEQCMGVIGQLIRDLEKCKGFLIKEILQSNLTVQNSFEQTIIARNQKIMHDPFNNNSLYLASIIANETLPLRQDITAMQTVLTVQDEETIKKKPISTIIKTFVDLGYACARLQLPKKETDYFSKALHYTSPEYYAKLNFESLGSAQQKNEPIMLEEQVGAIYIAKQGHQVIIADSDPMWVQNKITVLLSLSQCLMRQKKFAEAREYLQQAYEIYGDSTSQKKPIYCAMLSNLLIATFSSDNSQLDSYNRELEFLKENDYKCFVRACIHYANGHFSLGNTDAANKKLEEIDYEKIKDIGLSINISLLDGIIFSSMADEIDKRLNLAEYDDNETCIKICSQSLDLRKTAIAALKTALALYESNLSILKCSEGDYIREIFTDITSNLSISLGNQAARLLEYKPGKAYKLIKEALELQIKFEHDVSTSYTTLGAACEKMYEQTSDFCYLNEGLQAFDMNTSHESIRVKAIAFAGKAFILNKLERYTDTVVCLLEAKLFYFLLTKSKKNSSDEREEKWIKKRLKEISSTQNSEYVKALKIHEHSGDALRADSQFKQAIEAYKKCLFGLEYLADTPTKKRIELKLTDVNKLVSISEKYSANKQRIWGKSEKNTSRTDAANNSSKNNYCGFGKGFLK